MELLLLLLSYEIHSEEYASLGPLHPHLHPRPTLEQNSGPDTSMLVDTALGLPNLAWHQNDQGSYRPQAPVP